MQNGSFAKLASQSAAIVSPPKEHINEFSSGLWNDLQTSLTQARMRTSDRVIAAFDADGTLWDDDAGERFFQWQIDHCGFGHLPEDPWSYYRELKKKDPQSAYGWLAQINAGRTLEEVRAWAEACFQSLAPWPYFKSQKLLIDHLHTLGVEVYVVTASIKWAVEPAAFHIMGIPPERVLGVTTDLVGDRSDLVGTQISLPVTYRQGKADALLKATGGRRPVLSCGNTYGDIQLIDIASDFKLMIQSQSALTSVRPGLLSEELRLREYGRPLGWRLHAFRS